MSSFPYRLNLLNRLPPVVGWQRRSLSSRLAYESMGSDKSDRVALFLHGLMGSKRNWRTPMREFLKRHPEFRCLAVDLRGHGESASRTFGLPLESHSVFSASEDVVHFLQEMNLHPTIVFAHSFGGKVALQFLDIQLKSSSPIPAHTWILDSVPGKYSDKGHNSPNSVSNIIDTIRKMPTKFSSRDMMIKDIQSRGISVNISTWLGTNMVPSNDGAFTWCFDIEVIKRLFDQYCETDLWDSVYGFPEPSNAQASGKLHFIRAGRNKAWKQEHLEQFSKLEGNSNVQLVTMPHVGHWLHSEDLHGVLDIVDNNSSRAFW